MVQKVTLSVCAISYNEERDLPGFIEHLIDWVDEIVIVDDGSTDDTALIAGKYPGKVKFKVNKMVEKDFGAQRNIALDLATSDWLLHMDIDERVTPQLAKELLAAINQTEKNAFKYRRQNFFLNRPMRGGGFQNWNHAQLARRGKHKFINKIHEVCVVDGGKQATGQLNEYMWHLNDTDYAERIRKSVTYTQLEANKLINSGKRVKWYHLIMRPLARTCKRYFYEQGFKDGIPGLLFALHCFTAIFKVNALAWSKQNGIERADVEKAVMDSWKKSSSST